MRAEDRAKGLAYRKKVLFVNDQCAIGGVSTQTRSLGTVLRGLGIECNYYFYSDGGGRSLFDSEFTYWVNPERSLVDCLCDEYYSGIIADLSTIKHGAGKAVTTTGYEKQTVGVCHGYASVPLAKQVGWKLVAVSHYIEGMLSQAVKRSTQVIPNGIDTDVFNPDGPAEHFERPTALWVGRSSDPCKDYPGFACAAALLAERGYEIVVVDGDFDSQWATLSQWLGDAVKTYRVELPEVLAGLYRGVARSGGFYISTSKEESLGLAIIEAMACGCPVVAPGVGGIPETVNDSSTGVLYDRNSALRFIESQVLGQLCDQSFRKHIVGQALEFVQAKYDIRTVAQQYLELLDVGSSPTRLSVITKNVIKHAARVRRTLNKVKRWRR